jgi:hypothetical protein
VVKLLVSKLTRPCCHLHDVFGTNPYYLAKRFCIVCFPCKATQRAGIGPTTRFAQREVASWPSDQINSLRNVQTSTENSAIIPRLIKESVVAKLLGMKLTRPRGHLPTLSTLRNPRLVLPRRHWESSIRVYRHARPTSSTSALRPTSSTPLLHPLCC